MKRIGAFALFGAAFLSGLPGLRPRITSPAFVLGRVGVPFSYRITASRAPTEFAATFPTGSGLSVRADSGWIAGTPAAAGVFSMEVRARNLLGEGTQRVSLVIRPPSPLDMGWSGARVP